MTKLNESLTFPNGTTISNRFVMPPMLTNSGKDGYATSDTVNYYQARSQAGGMIITEYMYVSENGGPAMTWQNDREQLAVYDDRFVPQLAKVAAAIKQSGDKAIMQIAHTGREANYRAMTERPVYAPSAIDYPFLPYRVHEFIDAQIKQVIADFGAAVKRAVDAGFDGVEIHGANHYLIQQFFSQYSNRRTDHWGGTLEKRMNFPVAVVQSVMEAVQKYAPQGFIVGYRISPEEIHGENVGYTWHESTQLIDRLTKEFNLDYIHLSMLQYDAKPGDALLMDTEQAAQQFDDSDQPFATLFKPYLNGAKEVIVGSVTSQEQAERALGLADLVAAGRENLIDPLFAHKVLTGHADQVVTTLTADQARASHLTPGLIANFSAPQMGIPINRADDMKNLHTGFGGWTEMNYPANPEIK